MAKTADAPTGAITLRNIGFNFVILPSLGFDILGLGNFYKGQKDMPNYYFIEIWTPFKILGIRLFRDDEMGVWIKFWNTRRRRLRN